MQRVVELPPRGRLIVATDLQGHLADFEQIEQVFERAVAEDPQAVLVITGDLVHGPEIHKEQWPAYLGSFFEGDSVTLLDRAEKLAARHPGRVHYLLGNHEHAHLGGPIVAKFFPDEAKRLEALLGPERSAHVRSWFSGWPLIALARHSRMLLMHAAPAAVLRSPAQLEELSFEPPSGQPGNVDPLLGQLLWARTATSFRARAFLDAFDPTLQVAIYGHDVAREGYAIDREPLLCISTSFGCYDGDKLYLDWDLACQAQSAQHVASLGLRPLYPDRAPVYSGLRPPGSMQIPQPPGGDSANNGP